MRQSPRPRASAPAVRITSWPSCRAPVGWHPAILPLAPIRYKPFADKGLSYERATDRRRGVLRRAADRHLGAWGGLRWADFADRRRAASAVSAPAAVERLSHWQGRRERAADPPATIPGAEPHRAAH